MCSHSLSFSHLLLVYVAFIHLLCLIVSCSRKVKCHLLFHINVLQSLREREREKIKWCFLLAS